MNPPTQQTRRWMGECMERHTLHQAQQPTKYKHQTHIPKQHAQHKHLGRPELTELIKIANRTVKQTPNKKLEEVMVTVYGDLMLDKDEKEFLALGPDFALLDDLKSIKATKEFLIAMVKIRWGRMGKSEDGISKFIDEELEEEDKLIEEEIFMNERVFAEENKTLDLRKKR